MRSIVEVTSPDMRHDVPFKSNLSPLGGMGEGFRIFPRYADALQEGQVPIKLFRSTERRAKLTGISLLSWHFYADFKEAVAEVIQRSCRVQVLIMHEENPALPEMLNDSVSDQVRKVRDEIGQSWDAWQQIATDGGRAVEVRKVSRGVIYQQLIMNEARMLYSPYRFSVGSPKSNTIQTDRTSPLYMSLDEKFDALWQRNEEQGRQLKRKPAA